MAPALFEIPAQAFVDGELTPELAMNGHSELTQLGRYSLFCSVPG
jgi:hypothetical protein